MKIKQKNLAPYLLLLPALALLLVFRIYPMISTVIESFYTNNLTADAREFVGFANFTRVLSDQIFWKSLKVTFVFNLINIPIQVFLALVVAVILNSRARGISLFRSIVMIPIAVSPVVSTTLWKTMMDYNAGVLNGLLALVGIPRQEFFLVKEQALWSIVIVTAWKGIPYMMIFFLAGLQEIPVAVLEAAKIDGASSWQSFFKITLPLLKRVFAFVLVTDTILNLILFAPIWLITKGGPQLSTNLIMYETYRRGMVYGDLGGSSAMLIVVILIVAIVLGLQFLALRTDD
ncbi:MAG: sugar ABC transporter permease [Chloroflexi bacterium]|nr:sugar ABC transporter permease [Chloroflexota bacterium]MBT4003015.1 sugar ABC transporter permease [Chloroflexota bacterium]MBT4306615.1 sugar ABC transporter permease [Chloroflexota bacterium]MBT4533882.1 sugar ABC transporter permease [Chloroflexota bacterium]MBT4681888.1 sugar ABC transporter permease [Chloroflexota bacterium]